MENQIAQLNRKKRLARIIFLILPTWLVCFFILWQTGKYFSVIMESQYLLQSVYLGLGMLASALFYSFRFRFLTTFSVLVFGLYILYAAIDSIAVGEFDSFFYSIQFLVFSVLFSLGWLLSWAFIRKEKFPIIVAFVFFILSIFLIVKQKEVTVNSLFQAFVPIILYSLYVWYAIQLIAHNKDLSQPFWSFIIKRLVLFLLFGLLIIGIVLWNFRAEIKSKVEAYGKGGQQKESMLKQNKDQSFSLKDFTKLSGSQGRGNQLLFVAKIDNYFENGQPNPLYLTAFSYAKYDSETQTFEQDSLMPQNDLFRPNPSKIGLYFTKTDSGVLKNTIKDKLMKTVDIEVYKTGLSANEFVAPITSFFVQPIAVDKGNKEEYKSAYRAKSYVSELNSAYFVYNPGNIEALKDFQEMRYELLRDVHDYSGVSKQFFDYYTDIPTKGNFSEIGALAKKITAGKTNNLDKVIAIRDYFLSKDENGKALFKYSDNPGIPDIPSASKLNYFLFENRKGYCAYYAGATLFMLRSLGIPSRIAAGFLTQDRNSGNNKGWYWFYADQAHAWVQVYFPGYGWLDFDTTVGNDEAQQAPQPDGTPPNAPGNAEWAIDGVIKDVDTLQKLAKIKSNKFIFKDKVFSLNEIEIVSLNLSVANIGKDSMSIPISKLNIGDSVIAVSFAEVYKKIPINPSLSNKELLMGLPKPAPVDELQIKIDKKEKVVDKPKVEPKPLFIATRTWAVIIAGIVFLLGLLFLFSGYLYKSYLNLRANFAKSFSEKTYWNFRFVQFYLHQLGFERMHLSALEFAKVIDQKIPMQYQKYVESYLKLKYAQQALMPEEQQRLDHFKPHFIAILHKNIPSKIRVKRMLNPIRTISFLKIGSEK
ncbi:MAG TPA: transglutaminase domain-containing protein [Edaphocola sp.]|nr:transglutaminase domain-containing protein [Edaphocola sp.]